jgi:hypothetical protein
MRLPFFPFLPISRLDEQTIKRPKKEKLTRQHLGVTPVTSLIALSVYHSSPNAPSLVKEVMYRWDQVSVRGREG